MEWSISALFLPFLFGTVGGIFGTVLVRWYLHRITLDLDYRLSDLEGRVNREVKIRAGTETAKKRKADEEIAEALLRQNSQDNLQSQAPPNLSQWIQKQYRRVN